MATGDLANAAGLVVFSDTSDVNTGAENDNVRGDELADHLLNGGHPWSKISGKPARFPAATDSVGTNQLKDEAVTTAKIRQRAVGTAQLALDSVYGGIIAEEGVDTPHLADGAVRRRTIGPRAVDSDQLELDSVHGGIIATGGVLWDHLAPGVQDRIDGNTSSRRYKEDIAPADVDPATVLALEPVTYHHRSALPGTRELGLIAEDVHAAGVHPLVVWRDDVVDGVRYDRLAVALLAVVKDQAAQLEQLRSDVEALAATTTPTEEG